jgi:hypothetical protein
MPTLQPFPAGGYRFINHQFQYSGGVAAEPGFRIERARFARPVPLPKVSMRSKPTSPASDAHRPRSAPASCAPRRNSPTPALSRSIRIMSSDWPPGVFRDEINPVARSNVWPEIDPPATPSFYAFSYTVPSENRMRRSFVAAGSGEAREGGPS